jgi:hypothetical protein
MSALCHKQTFALKLHGLKRAGQVRLFVSQNEKPRRQNGGVSEAEACMKVTFICLVLSQAFTRDHSRLCNYQFLFWRPSKHNLSLAPSGSWLREPHGAPDLCPVEYLPYRTSLSCISSCQPQGASLTFTPLSSRIANLAGTKSLASRNLRRLNAPKKRCVGRSPSYGSELSSRQLFASSIRKVLWFHIGLSHLEHETRD